MITRRRLIVALGAGALSVPFASFAQQHGKVWRIGVLEWASMVQNFANLDAFRQGLREFGYVEPQNLVLEYLSADGRTERFPELASELVRLKVDLILARGSPATLAAKKTTATIPIVMTGVGDPVNVGAVGNLAHPGGNVTGLASFTPLLEPKRLELLKDLIPGLTRVAALMNMGNPGRVLAWKAIEKAARPLGIQLELLDVRKAEDLERAFDAATRQRAGALLVGQDGFTLANQRTIAELAAKHRLPAIYGAGEFVASGGLISYSVSYPPLYYRAASFVNKIFKGAKPGDIPVEQPTKFELVINMKTAKALGVKIPDVIMLRADRVIE